MIAIVDYEAGNSTSVSNAVSSLGFENVVTDDLSVIESADKIIFPGVGAAGAAMDSLREKKLDEALKNAVASGKPVLGICVGCQVILNSSEEDGGVDCLGLIEGQAIKFQKEEGIKIPHMGWNQIQFDESSFLFQGLKQGSEVYFVHSFHPDLNDDANSLAKCTFGTQTFDCVLRNKNLVATQFHTEKSGKVGLQILKNFCEWDGVC